VSVDGEYVYKEKPIKWILVKSTYLGDIDHRSDDPLSVACLEGILYDLGSDTPQERLSKGMVDEISVGDRGHATVKVCCFVSKHK